MICHWLSKGKDQAQIFASALLEKNIRPNSVYCGPLQRTREFAQIIIQGLNLDMDPIVDVRLDELDYGHWAGLTDQEIREKFGNELDAWEKSGKWPKNSEWTESEKDIIQQVKSLTKEFMQMYKSDDVVLVVSSNGRLRYFLNLIDNEFKSRIKTGHVKVGTGNACVIACDSGNFELVAWNINPVEL